MKQCFLFFIIFLGLFLVLICGLLTSILTHFNLLLTIICPKFVSEWQTATLRAWNAENDRLIESKTSCLTMYLRPFLCTEKIEGKDLLPFHWYHQSNKMKLVAWYLYLVFYIFADKYILWSTFHASTLRTISEQDTDRVSESRWREQRGTSCTSGSPTVRRCVRLGFSNVQPKVFDTCKNLSIMASKHIALSTFTD